MTTNEAPRTFAEWWMTPEGAFDHSHEKAALAAWNAAIASLPSGDYAGLVERLQDNRRAGYEQDADCVEAADAIKALERKKVELAQLLLKAIKSDLKAESDLAACLGYAEEMADELDDGFPHPSAEAFHIWRDSLKEPSNDK